MAGGQMMFPSSINGSGGVNTLDDYEEGLFTPTLVATTTNYTTVNYHADTAGSYTKIGNMVLCQITCRTTSVTLGSSAGYMTVQGLPFAADSRTAAGDDSEWTCHIHAGDHFDSGKFPSGGYLSPGSTTLYIYYNTNGTSSMTPLDHNHMDAGNGVRIQCTVMYRTAD